MSSLQGSKIAVLVESQYIPEEIATYQRVFSDQGAQVQLFSRLWGNLQLDFVSEVEQAGQVPQLLTVTWAIERFFLEPHDPAYLDLSQYDALLVAANYVAVRLRYFTPDETMRTTPAVKLFFRAMHDRRLIKGALCHALWLATPCREVLAGRRVTCHEVVEADIYNAGADIQREYVVKDHDLVTGKSAKEAEIYAQAIIDQIQLVKRSPARPW